MIVEEAMNEDETQNVTIEAEEGNASGVEDDTIVEEAMIDMTEDVVEVKTEKRESETEMKERTAGTFAKLENVTGGKRTARNANSDMRRKK